MRKGIEKVFVVLSIAIAVLFLTILLGNFGTNGILAKAFSYNETVSGSDGVYTISGNEGWSLGNSNAFWYEKGVRQGTASDPKGVMGDGTVRGREIYDPSSDAWYWLDAIYSGQKAVKKEVWIPYIYSNESTFDATTIENLSRESDTYTESNIKAKMSEQVSNAIKNKTGKWVRYDANGKMIKGWYTVEGVEASIYPGQAGNTYYYDYKTGLMAKGRTEVDGKIYYFDEITGVRK